MVFAVNLPELETIRGREEGLIVVPVTAEQGVRGAEEQVGAKGDFEILEGFQNDFRGQEGAFVPEIQGIAKLEQEVTPPEFLVDLAVEIEIFLPVEKDVRFVLKNMLMGELHVGVPIPFADIVHAKDGMRRRFGYGVEAFGDQGLPVEIGPFAPEAELVQGCLEFPPDDVLPRIIGIQGRPSG